MMAYPVPNSDDPDLFDESKQLKGWNLLVYKCKQQPLVPIGFRLSRDEVDYRCCSDMFCITRCCSNGVQKEFQRHAILLPGPCGRAGIHGPRVMGGNLRV